MAQIRSVWNWKQEYLKPYNSIEQIIMSVLHQWFADGLSLDFEWQQDSFRTLLSFLADLNNAVVWMVSARPPITNSSSPLTKPLRIIPGELITISIKITFMFHIF